MYMKSPLGQICLRTPSVCSVFHQGGCGCSLEEHLAASELHKSLESPVAKNGSEHHGDIQCTCSSITGWGHHKNGSQQYGDIGKI